MSRRIVALVDLSISSGTVLNAAARWCEWTGSKLVVYHRAVVTPPAMADAVVRRSMETRTVEAERDRLVGLCEALPLAVRDGMEVIVETRPLMEGLAILQADHEPLLAVCGLKKRGMLGRLLYGSTVLDIIDGLDLPLFAVGQGHELTSMPLFCLAVGLRVDPDIKRIRELDQALAGHVQGWHLFTALDDEKDSPLAKERLSDLSSGLVARRVPYSLLDASHGSAAVDQWVKARNGAILVVQRGPRGLKDHFLRKFFINDLVMDADLPLLILP